MADVPNYDPGWGTTLVPTEPEWVDDDRDYAEEDRKVCQKQGHPLAYVSNAFGPSCECGERMGFSGFPAGDIAQWQMDAAIYQHDKVQKA